MALRIVPFESGREPAVAAFNARAREHGAPFELSRTPVAGWLPKRDGCTLWREFFIALDGEEVRGGFTLRRQEFWLRGHAMRMANYQGPLSEGIWDRRCMMAGVQMLRAALREEPLLYALGMGGIDQLLPRLLASAGWSLAPVPFRFTVLRPGAFLRHIRPLRRTGARRWLLDFAAATGLGTIMVHAAQALRSRHRLPPQCECEPVDEFGDWADSIWAQARGSYDFTAIRDRAAQNCLFGSSDKNIALRCTHEGRDLGWAVVRSTQMRDDKYFGDLCVGTLVDALALPGAEATVVALATQHLRGLGSDLVVTNQTHARWVDALRACGWFAGPSNFIFACSPQLSESLGPLETALPTIHFNRADGDGPIHL